MQLIKSEPYKLRWDEHLVYHEYGYCYYYVNEDSAGIFNLYIAPVFRRHGYARQIINECILAIRTFGYKNQIIVEADPYESNLTKNDLISFYESMDLNVINK